MTWLLAQVSTRHTNSLSLGLAPSYLRYSFFVTLVMTFRKKSRLPGHSSDSSSLIEPSRKKSVEVGPPLQLIKSAFFSVLRCTYSQVMRKNGFECNFAFKKETNEEYFDLLSDKQSKHLNCSMNNKERAKVKKYMCY